MSMLRKKHALGLYAVSILFLCLSATALLYRVSSANAITLLARGISGTCTWEYERINDDIVFVLCPTRGREGILEDWMNSPRFAHLSEWQHLPSWHNNRCYEQVTRVIVRGRVKPRTCQNMFMYFKNAKFFDLSGLDMSGVNNMKYMFYGCSVLPSLDLSMWNVSRVTNMDGMFCYNSALTSLNLNGWDVSGVSTMNYMFSGCSSLVSLGIDQWNVSNVIQMIGMFDRCSSLTSLDVNGWNVSHVTCMGNMFSNCSALTSLDLRGWDMGAVNSMPAMFQKTSSLKRICVGRRFCIHENAAFDQAGADVGTYWVQVSLGDGGTQENPRGKAFTSANDLLTFHANRKDAGNGVEEYVRIVGGPTTIIFDKGSCDASGTMCPQMFAYNEKKALLQNNYQLCNHLFCGWIDSEGNFYRDGETFADTCPAHNASKVLTAQWKKDEKSTPSASAADSYARTHTIRFDTNVSSQKDTSSAFSELTVSDGEGVKIPDTHRPVRANHTFLGWNMRADGRGGMYMPGASIDNVRSDITLYAQWKGNDAVKLTYAVHDNRGGTVSCTYEEISDYAGIPEGCTAQPDKGHFFKKWACTVAGCTWYSTEPTLKKEQIDLFAKKNGLYVPTTFTAYFEREMTADSTSDTLPAKSDAKADETAAAKPDEKATASCGLAASASSANVQQRPENKVKLSYVVNDSEKGNLSRKTETISDSTGIPRGSFAHAWNSDKSTFVKWTCDTNAEWYGKDALLEQEEIEKVAKKDGVYVPTTFTAHFEFKLHSIKFDTTSHVLKVQNGEDVQIPLTYVPALRRNDAFFSWNSRKDGTGNEYFPGDTIKTVFGDITLYPQWDENTAVLTYAVDDSEKGRVSQESETISVKSRNLKGSFAYVRNEEKYVFEKWICNVDSAWSCEKAMLRQEDIDKVAKKDGAYVPVTFTACFAPRVYTITFDAVTHTPLTAEYGKSVQIPTSYVPIEQTGQDSVGWNTKRDGSGKSYLPGDTITDITKDMTLYPQWKEATAVLTYVVDDPQKGSVTYEREVVSASGKALKGSFAYVTDNKKYVFDKWTCDINSGWSYNRAALEPEEIERIAKKDGVYVTVTFTAHFKEVQEMTALR